MGGACACEHGTQCIVQEVSAPCKGLAAARDFRGGDDEVALSFVDSFEGGDPMSSPQCVSLSSIDFEVITPAGWTRTSDEVPACFCLVGMAAVVVRPLARGHLEPVAPMGERHVLVCLSRSALEIKRLQAYGRACSERDVGKGLLPILNVVEDQGLIYLETAHPEGESLQEIVDGERNFDEACGKICCRQLMRMAAHLHRHALWLRGCIHTSAITVSPDGTVLSVFPWAGLLSLYGLSNLARAFSASDVVGIAPELLSASTSRGVRLSAVAGFGQASDVYAVASMVFQAITLRVPLEVHDIARGSSLSASLFDFFVRALQQDPLFRLDMISALTHPWLSDSA